MIKYIYILTFISFFNLINAQNSRKYLFFEYKQDSIKSRTITCSAPTNTQTFSLNSSIVNDYIGNVKLSVITGIITSKKDTTLALHSLINGAGNVSIDAEWPFAVWQTRRNIQKDFFGLSLNPRMSAVINNTQTIETSMISYDFGLNFSGKFTGDLGNISLKYILRNSICVGNYQFVKSAFGFDSKEFYYSSFQLKIKTGQNSFSISRPLYIYSKNTKIIQNLPIYVGYSMLF